LFEMIWSSLAPFRERRAEWAGAPERVKAVLQQGAERARQEADRTLQAARRAMGLMAL